MIEALVAMMQSTKPRAAAAEFMGEVRVTQARLAQFKTQIQSLEVQLRSVEAGGAKCAVPGWVRSKARSSPEWKPLQQSATWPGLPKDPPVDVDEMEVEDAKLDLEFDAKHAWNPRERVIIREAEDYLGRSGEILVEVGELEVYVLCPTGVTGIVDVLAKNACDREEH